MVGGCATVATVTTAIDAPRKLENGPELNSHELKAINKIDIIWDPYKRWYRL